MGDEVEALVEFGGAAAAPHWPHERCVPCDGGALLSLAAGQQYVAEAFVPALAVGTAEREARWAGRKDCSWRVEFTASDECGAVEL